MASTFRHCQHLGFPEPTRPRATRYSLSSLDRPANVHFQLARGECGSYTTAMAVTFRGLLSHLPSRATCKAYGYPEAPLDSDALPTFAFATAGHPTRAELARLLFPPLPVPVPEGRLVVIQGPDSTPLQSLIVESYDPERRQFHERRGATPPDEFTRSVDEWRAFIHVVRMGNAVKNEARLDGAVFHIGGQHVSPAAVRNYHSAAIVFLDCARPDDVTVGQMASVAIDYLHPRGVIIAFANDGDAEQDFVRLLDSVLIKRKLNTVSTQFTYKDSGYGAANGLLFVGRRPPPLVRTEAIPKSTKDRATRRPVELLNFTPVPPSPGIRWARLTPDDLDDASSPPVGACHDEMILTPSSPTPTRDRWTF